MDSFDFANNTLNPGNSSSTPRYHHQLPKLIKNLFRITEISLSLAVLTSASTYLPFAVKVTLEYFRLFIGVVVSPLFIFLLGNAIVLILYLKSRRNFPEHSRISLEAHFEFCQESVTIGDDHCTHFTLEKPEEVVFQDKQTIVEVTTVTKARRRSEESKNLRKGGSWGKQLRSLETQKQRRRVAGDGEVEKLSNEEFQRTIDAFIAKQIKFHREEQVAIVLDFNQRNTK